jgi:hypothetical protein
MRPEIWLASSVKKAVSSRPRRLLAIKCFCGSSEPKAGRSTLPGSWPGGTPIICKENRAPFATAASLATPRSPFRVETMNTGTERGSAAGSPAPDRLIDAQPAARIKAQPARMKQRRLATFGHRAGSRREMRGLPSRAIALWFKLRARMNASNFAKNLPKPASCPWLCGLPVSGRQTCPECDQACKPGVAEAIQRGRESRGLRYQFNGRVSSGSARLPWLLNKVQFGNK